MSTKAHLVEKSDKYNYAVYETEDGIYKLFMSEDANYQFNKVTGQMLSWGKTVKEDPAEFPAPNILDLEITTSCSHNCPFCYKSNNKDGKNMSFETFKKIFDVLPKSITQIAFGADYDLTSNPELPNMMHYAKEHGVIPNVTVGYVSDTMADTLAEYCGAVAVSRYESKDRCYDSIKKLTDRGMTQVNMHYMISEETYDRAIETLHDIKEDPRLEKLNAIVFLSLKKKGRGVDFHILSQEKFNSLVSLAQELNIGIGFDSCSSLKAYRAFEDERVRNSIIPCEAGGQESSYINVEGMYYPCSFCEGEVSVAYTTPDPNKTWVDEKGRVCTTFIGRVGTELDWREGLNVLECTSSEDFLDKVWFNKKTQVFKEVIQKTASCNKEKCKTCPMFEV